jgi:hypothetical protein
MAAIRSTGKEYGLWGLIVKDVFLISMAAIRNLSKENRQSKNYSKFSLVAIRSIGKEHG